MARVYRAWITVITLAEFTGVTSAIFKAEITNSTGISILAVNLLAIGNHDRMRNALACGRITRLVCAEIVIRRADNRSDNTSECWITGVNSAIVVVIADDRSEETSCVRVAGVSRAMVAIVADERVLECAIAIVALARTITDIGLLTCALGIVSHIPVLTAFVTITIVNSAIAVVIAITWRPRNTDRNAIVGSVTSISNRARISIIANAAIDSRASHALPCCSTAEGLLALIRIRRADFRPGDT